MRLGFPVNNGTAIKRGERDREWFLFWQKLEIYVDFEFVCGVQYLKCNIQSYFIKNTYLQQIKARPTRCNNSDLLVIDCSSTCFGRLWGGRCLTASSSQCTLLATRLSSITTATTGQKTIGSVTQSDLLMMGVKAPETCWGTNDYQQITIVASSWSCLYLLIKDARSFEHKVYIFTVIFRPELNNIKPSKCSHAP
jgi:hypothetical protein